MYIIYIYLLYITVRNIHTQEHMVNTAYRVVKIKDRLALYFIVTLHCKLGQII